MNKKEKLYNLRANMSIQAEHVEVLLEHIVYKTENSVETCVLGEIALKKSRKISRMSEKIGRILKH